MYRSSLDYIRYFIFDPHSMESGFTNSCQISTLVKKGRGFVIQIPVKAIGPRVLRD